MLSYLHRVCFSTGSLTIGKYGGIVTREDICGRGGEIRRDGRGGRKAGRGGRERTEEVGEWTDVMVKHMD